MKEQSILVTILKRIIQLLNPLTYECFIFRFLRINKNILKWKAPSNEFEPVEFFDTTKAWDALLSLPSCQEIMIQYINSLVAYSVTYV